MGHFIYQIVFLIILGSRKASGLQCYGGSGAPEQCLGICGTMTALEDGTTTDGQQVKNGESKTGCLTNTGMTGCIEMLLEGIQTQVCVCTTDFCNGGGGVRVKRGAGTLDETGETDETENSSGGKGGMIGGIAGAVALIVIVVCVICCFCKCCNSKSKSTKTNTKTSKNITFMA